MDIICPCCGSAADFCGNEMPNDMQALCMDCEGTIYREVMSIERRYL
ncbi:hypothetical protein HYT53_01885 [Candidatus Woesearchaeota archaeon]|nr:hypothetical protein [Candidatus Woesearchaeota archaeon]